MLKEIGRDWKKISLEDLEQIYNDAMLLLEIIEDDKERKVYSIIIKRIKSLYFIIATKLDNK